MLIAVSQMVLSAGNCLDMATIVADRRARLIQRKFAAEWLKWADLFSKAEQAAEPWRAGRSAARVGHLVRAAFHRIDDRKAAIARKEAAHDSETALRCLGTGIRTSSIGGGFTERTSLRTLLSSDASAFFYSFTAMRAAEESYL
jgi:hypothetical protein